MSAWLVAGHKERSYYFRMLKGPDALPQGTAGAHRLVVRLQCCLDEFERPDPMRQDRRERAELIVSSRQRLAERGGRIDDDLLPIAQRFIEEDEQRHAALRAQLKTLATRVGMEFDVRGLDPTPVLRLAETLDPAHLSEAHVALRRLAVRLTVETPQFIMIDFGPPEPDEAPLSTRGVDAVEEAETRPPTLTVDDDALSVRWGERELDLSDSPVLFRLIKRLDEARGKFLGCDTLRREVWGRQIEDSTIRSAVSRLKTTLRAQQMDEIADRVEKRDGRYRLAKG